MHGCGGMPDTTKRKLADELVAWCYVNLMVDSFATRGIDQACTFSGLSAIARKRTSDTYGALAFLAGQTFVDPQRVAAVGFSQSGWVTLSVAEANSFELFVLPSNLRFRAAVASFLCAGLQGRARRYPRSFLLGPSTNGRQRQTAPRKLTLGALTGYRSSKSAIPALTMVSTIWNSNPTGPYLAVGGIQWRGSEQCEPPDGAVSRSPSQLRACQSR